MSSATASANFKPPPDQASPTFAHISLIDALRPWAKGNPTCRRFAPQKLIALEIFAQTCRLHGRPPQSIDSAFMREIDGAYGSNRRRAYRTSANLMDDVRDIPAAVPFLPPAPIAFVKNDHAKQAEIPAPFLAEIETWIRMTVETNWDPIDREFTSRHVAHGKSAWSAFRNYLRTAVSIGAIEAVAPSCLPAFLDAAIVQTVVKAMLARTEQITGARALSPRTLRQYIKTIVQVLRTAGHEPTTLAEALIANRVLVDGARADKSMTPGNQAFCERLVARPDLQKRFLGSFLRLRRAAQQILDRARAEGRALTPRERSRVCVLGMCAAFTAVEIAGAPLRISNVLNAKIFGDDAWIQLPTKGSGVIRVHIPASHTKAGVEDIRFEIKPDRYRGHETILWFVREIRPLIPGAADNAHFLPSPRNCGAPVSAGWFRDEFQAAMRAIVGLPTSPHQLRHGQASLLLNRFPGETVVIAKRTGHSVRTLLRYYAFLDAIRAMERGQDMLMGLLDD